MKIIRRQKKLLRQRAGIALVSASVFSFAAVLYFSFFTGLNTTAPVSDVKASTNMTFPAQSFIMNMGITPQTEENALYPYGLVYELMSRWNVPVHWSIEPTKSKDGIDFTYNGTDYSGGPFVVHADHITQTVRNRINYWRNLGVEGVFTTSSVTIPIYTEIKYYPRILIDDLSGNSKIIIDYFDNARIGSSAYTIGTPDDATECFDVWVNPHGDPTWATHGNLKTFVETHQGFIWSQCHAVSALEGSMDVSDPSTQMNFLSTTGLQCYHKNTTDRCGPLITEEHPNKHTNPVSHNFPAEPVMQFMGNANIPLSSNGSESWFIPQTSGRWRSSTMRTITTSDGVAPGEGILQAYGPAYGDTTYGWVMYSAGHDHLGGGTAEEKIAAQRSFLNFMLLCGKLRDPFVSTSIDAVMTGYNWYNFSATPSGGIPPYTYRWSSNVGGTFLSPDSSSTAFISPDVSSPTTGAIICQITDACGRLILQTQIVTISPSPLPITLTEFTANPKGFNKVLTEWTTEAELNNRYFTVERSKNGRDFMHVGDVPTQGNSVSTKYYSLTDHNPFNGTSYYRLKQTDLDGSYRYFDPVMVRLNIPVILETVGVSPNPFNTRINIDLDLEKDAALIISLIDLNGRELFNDEIHRRRGRSSFTITELGHLPKGYYILRVVSEEAVLSNTRLLKR